MQPGQGGAAAHKKQQGGGGAHGLEQQRSASMQALDSRACASAAQLSSRMPGKSPSKVGGGSCKLPQPLSARQPKARSPAFSPMSSVYSAAPRGARLEDAQTPTVEQTPNRMVDGMLAKSQKLVELMIEKGLWDDELSVPSGSEMEARLLLAGGSSKCSSTTALLQEIEERDLDGVHRRLAEIEEQLRRLNRRCSKPEGGKRLKRPNLILDCIGLEGSTTSTRPSSPDAASLFSMRSSSSEESKKCLPAELQKVTHEWNGGRADTGSREQEAQQHSDKEKLAKQASKSCLRKDAEHAGASASVPPGASASVPPSPAVTSRSVLTAMPAHIVTTQQAMPVAPAVLLSTTTRPMLHHSVSVTNVTNVYNIWPSRP